MEVETGKVKLNIVSVRGHDELVLEYGEALSRISQETTQNGKWCYIDGKFSRAGDITEQNIREATNITLVNQLTGG